MRLATICAVLALVTLIAQPVFADEARDYIDNEIADWTRIGVSNGYEILGTYIGEVGSEDVIYTFDLAPGTYRLYSSGGSRIEDLDLFVNDTEGRQLGSDTRSDKIPIVQFQIAERTEVEVRAQAWSFVAGYELGYFCLLVTAVTEGEIYEFEGETVFAVEGQAVEVEMEVEEEEDMEEMEGDRDDFHAEVEEYSGYWAEYEAELGNEVVESEIVLIDGMTYSMVFELKAGYYEAYATPDSRCLDLDMTIYDEYGEILDDDHLDDNFPMCEFFLLDDQEIELVIEVYEFFEDYDETWAGYMLAFVSAMDDESRQDYIDNEYDWMVSSTENTGEVMIDGGIDMLDYRQDSVTMEFDLEEGSYFCQGTGGLAMVNLDVAVYDDDGEILDEDVLDDNYPMAWFDLYEPETVTVEFTAIEFLEGLEDAWFAWILTETGDYYEDYEGYDSYWSGDEEELIDSAEILGETWLASIEAHREEIIDEFTEPIYYEGEDDGWSHEFELDRGVYYFYAQGDDICTTDIDMVIYDEEGEIVAEDYYPNNSPVCVVEVDRRGGTYKVAIMAYWLDCEVGYFKLYVTKE